MLKMSASVQKSSSQEIRRFKEILVSAVTRSMECVDANRSRQALSNKYFIVKIGVDTAEKIQRNIEFDI